MDQWFTARNVCLTGWITPSSLNSPAIFGMYFHVPGSRRVCCPTWVGEWALWGLHQTLDSNIPVNYTTSQPQRWAHKPPSPSPPPHNSKRKEFAGWLRVLAERVAAGEDRGCCWSELICSCFLCVMVTACRLVPPRQSPGHMEKPELIHPWCTPCPPIIIYMLELWNHCAAV